MRTARVAAIICALCLPPTASAAVESFLCITDPPIPGPVTNAKFLDCIAVQGWSEADFLEGGLAEARDLRFGKAVDEASLPLQAAFANGAVLGQAVFKVRRAGGTGSGLDPHLIVKLLDARVTSYGFALVGETPPVESFSLRPARIEYTYFKQRADGSLILPAFAVMCWDLAAGSTTTGVCP
jgi:type VI protein secretion system component Hcp